MQVPSGNWNGLESRIGRLVACAQEQACEQLVLTEQATLSWLLGVRSHVPNTLDATCFDVVLDVQTRTLRIVVNAIEAPRLQANELAGVPAEFEVLPWWTDRRAQLPTGTRVGSDSGLPGMSDLTSQIALERRRLDDGQQVTLRSVCRDAAAAATAAAIAITPAMSEYVAAGKLAYELLARGLDPIVLMVAGDERMARDRHPIPTSGALGARAMLVCCARRHGVVASVTRIVAFDPVPRPRLAAYERLLRVEARFLEASKPGAVLGDVLRHGVEGYAAFGFEADEWHRHHQGGYSGWHSREFPARTNSCEILAEGEVLAWNPSADGWKVEDTCLIGVDGAEPLVYDDAWPMMSIDGRQRPAILELG
ncbi:MAG: M24 family metallopeptidase [Propionibacteriaceae bacterium]|nr:M24 family metallopeptidase [Propionibacteriaceae bacterium]